MLTFSNYVSLFVRNYVPLLSIMTKYIRYICTHTNLDTLKK